MQVWQVSLLTLAALLVGMITPVLFQLRTTLKELRAELRATREEIGPILSDARLSARRVRELTEGLEGKGKDLSDVLSSAGELARSLDRLRNTTAVAAAVATAVAAGIRAFRDSQRADGHEAARADRAEPRAAAEQDVSVQGGKGANRSPSAPGADGGTAPAYAIRSTSTTNHEEMQS